MGINQIRKGEEPGLFKKLIHALKGKGHYGEYLANFALSNDNLEGRLETFTNLIIPYRGRTTELDIVMLHEKGIYVFESKNYSGWIFGSEKQKQWTQTLEGGMKNRFGNPIKQNRSHVNALSEVLELPKNHFMSFIVFSNRCEFKKIPEDTSEFAICHQAVLLEKTRRVLSERSVLYSENEFERIAVKMHMLHATQVSKEEHIANVQKLQSGEICPWCGEKLVERNGKYGKFIGCSGYPKCRFTKNVK